MKRFKEGWRSGEERRVYKILGVVKAPGSGLISMAVNEIDLCHCMCFGP